jgi:hypothetical protein
MVTVTENRHIIYIDGGVKGKYIKSNKSQIIIIRRAPDH